MSQYQRANHEDILHVPMGEGFDERILAMIAEWAAQFPSICPRHGEPATPRTGWKPYHDYKAPHGSVSILATHTLEPCPICRLRLAGVPPLFQRCSFGNFDANTSELRDNLATVQKFASAPTGFLFLLGDVGNGKTHLAVSVLRQFGQGRYVRHLQLVEELRASYHRPRPADDDEEEGIADRYCGAPLLVLDELGVATGGNDAETLLHGILDHRVTHFLPTVLCANIGAGNLEASFGRRLADRFRQACCAVLNFTGPSRRASGNGAYLDAARAQVEARPR
jgi:DNA replication protein DnaC